MQGRCIRDVITRIDAIVTIFERIQQGIVLNLQKYFMIQ